MHHSRFLPTSITLSAVALGCTLTAQDSQSQATRLDQALRALAESDPRYGYAIAIAGLEGPIDVRVAGKIDDETAFERWHLVPLGAHTTLLLEAVMRDAIAHHKLRWEESVVGAGTGDVIDLDSAWFDGQVPLPGYQRFVQTPKEVRPLAEIIGTHAFRLPRHAFPVCDQGMLRSALAQAAVEHALGHFWSELLRDARSSLSMSSVIDLTHAWPARSVAVGHRGDGRPWPVRLTEVASAGNAACSVDDVAQLARACLRDELAGHPRSDAHELRPSRKFFVDEPTGFEVITRRSQSSMLGCTLDLQLLPEAQKVVVLFGTRPPDRWQDRLRTPALELALGVDAKPLQFDEMFATSESVVADQTTLIEGTYRGQVVLGSKTVEIEIQGKDHKGVARILGETEPGKPSREGSLSIGPDHALGEIEVEPATPDRAGLRYGLSVAVDPKDPTRLRGALYVSRATDDRIDLECLPYPALFTRLP